MGDIRKRLLAARDEAFLPATAQFRDRVNEVETAIWLEGMDTVAENDARAKLVELGEAAADLRVAVLRYLATGEANQRNAMQAAIALGHTALRPLLSAPASPSFRDQVLALQQAFTELGATASQLAGFTTQMAAHQRDGDGPRTRGGGAASRRPRRDLHRRCRRRPRRSPPRKAPPCAATS
ncbi:MAG: hypothetical protein RML45_11410 [Acetobacteraceae bacterium]|nr:hypothetical protein [Acetobacteraceae bacterium]